MNSKCVIVGAGDFAPENLHRRNGDILIAADNGLMSLLRMGEEPDYVIGDFDSLALDGQGPMAALREQNPERIRTLPKEKNDTDTVAAVRWGLELGYRRFYLYGALGGTRVDHTMANLQTLLLIDAHGAQGYIVDERQIIFLIRNDKRTFRSGLCGMISLFAADPRIRVTIEGMKYNCEQMEITYDFPIGCSNEFLPDRRASIEVRDGAAFVVAQRPGAG